MIDVIDLNKVFDNGFEALKSVNFSIEQGDLVCLLGPSGCGKSTILNLIAGLLTPTGGDIQFKGSSVVTTEPKDRNIGFVFQNYALYPHMTVLENIMFPLTVGKNKISKEEAQKIIDLATKRRNEILESVQAEAEVERQRIIEQGYEEVESQRKRVQEELRQKVAALAVAGAEKIVGRSVDSAANNDIIDKLVADL